MTSLMLMIQAVQATPAVGARSAHALDGTIAEWIWLLPLLPLAGALINGAIALGGAMRADRNRTSVPSFVGPGVMAIAFVLAAAIFVAMRSASELSQPFIRNYAQWMPVGDLVINWGIQLDQLSIVMALVITGIGFLIHVFSVGYMKADPGYARYFAYLNLFVAFMLTLVLGSSYPVLFIGWEGVGLASYLLIGFWFSEKANADAGKKAFVTNRVGDFGFLVAMFMIWASTRSLDFVSAHSTLSQVPAGSGALLAIALFLFLGCAGKSAQLPLYIWLPDAMAGPTPVSALIHAATMVTAGVYLVARASPIFSGAPEASLVVASVGALTALFAATIALRQWDIKRVLAYSTISQLGYMFIGVGTGAYSAGIFHLVTHAFFKALLFLGAGAVIHALHEAYHHTHRYADAQDLRNMGGLRQHLPLTAGLMALATLAIAGVPPLSGFFSKDEILSGTFARAQSSPLASATLLGIPGQTVLFAVYAMGLLTALLTAIYMTRMFVLAFMGANRTGEAERAVLHEVPGTMTVPLVALGVLTLLGGWLNLPELLPLGKTGLLSHWLDPVTGASAARLAGAAELSHATEQLLVLAATAAAVIGIFIGWFVNRHPIADKEHAQADTGINAVLANAYGVDRAVDAVLLRPISAIGSTVLDRGVDRGVDNVLTGSGAFLVRAAGQIGHRLQDGDVGKYAWLVATGALVILAAMMWT